MDDLPRAALLLIASGAAGDGARLAKGLADICRFPLSARFAEDGVQALRSALADLPDWAILDGDLPALDGVAVAARIRAEFGGRAPKLVGVARDLESSHAPRAVAAFDEIFTAPLDVLAIASIVASARA